ncbi:MAG: sigma 54-interacting transcriptional regulator [Myxococcota bacterium]
MVGESPALWELRDRIAFTARQRGHVLVLGPSGSGKERVAQALHRLSSCGTKPLVARNAATIPTALMDVELFGHVANYPNPGMRERLGLVGEADGSTLFLDEIGELPDELQGHLLRLMDSGDYQRLGDARPRRVELRLVAATHRDPLQLKPDLRARFRHVLRVPPLIERREDLPLLMRHILRMAAAEDATIARHFFSDARTPDGRVIEPRVDLELVSAILRHPLPLQVRELEGLLWNAIATTMRAPEGTRLLLPAPPLPAAAAPDHAGAAEPGAAPDGGPTTSPTEVDKATLQAALDRHEGRLERVWRDLGLKNRYVLRRLLEKYGLRGARGDDSDPEA